MVTSPRALRCSLVALLVFQLGLAGTAGWLHLAAHDHAFSPDLHNLVDAPAPAPAGAGLSPEARVRSHCSVLLAIFKDSDDLRSPSAVAGLMAQPPRDAACWAPVPVQPPHQQPILSLAPSLSPPPLA